MKRLLLAALLAALAGCAAQHPLLELGLETPPRFEAVLKPLLGESGEVTAIHVDSVVYGALGDDADALSLTAPVVYAGAYGIADRVQELAVTDRRGRVPLAQEDDPVNPGGFPYFRHWTAQRDVTFPLRVSYRVEVEPPTGRRGPPFNIKPSQGGVSGAGSGFLVIPENATSGLSRVRWDLSQFEQAAAGVSSFGEGEFELASPPSELWQGWYMAGPVGRYPAAGDAAGFSAAWLGDFPFDPLAEMEFVSAGYAWLADFFGYLSPPPRYRVFMRVIDTPQTRFSGTALGTSFMLSGGPKSGEETNGAPPRGTFFHEMIHLWVGGIEGPQGVNSWFSEGLTSYYTLVLPLRGGFETAEEYGEGIKQLAESYYTSKALAMSADAIAAVGFGDEDIRRTPYSRGAIYFADLDARIRTTSGGKRSLDDLVREIFERRHSDKDYTFDHAAWTAAVSAELGSEAAAEFQARILDGEPIAPVPDAFGPCFERRLTRYPVADKHVPGYEWVRKPGIPDEMCAGLAGVPGEAGVALAAEATPAVPTLQIALKPVPGSDSRTIEAIEVTETLTGRAIQAGAALLELAYVTFNVPSAAGRIEELGARDEHGRLSLSARDLGEGDSASRQWFADRAPGEAITVSYRVAVAAPLAPRGAAPPTELRNEHGAVSGSGAAFLLRPPAGSYRVRVAWDLSSLPAGASAVSSLGYQPDEALPVDTLDSVYFMAGDLGRYPDDSSQAEFYSAWQGDPPFDADRLMASAETLREAFITFFNAERGGYGIMMRPNPVNPGGGIGLHRSFVITFDQQTDVEDLGLTLSHEMFHTFQPRMDAGGEPNSSLEHAWFNEGLAVFYQREFLFRAGLIGTDAYLRDLNTHAARYYTNALGDTPNSEVAAGFWRDTRIRTLPYDRGFLYFATVDETLRKASGNRRSLDDLAKEMRTLQDRGQAPTPAGWAALVRRELGDDGVSALDRMLAGGAPLPSSDAFGPCFRRISRDLQRYELGFEPAVLVEPERIVRGLVQGSAAELAGLRNDDRILKPVPQDAIQGDQAARLTLQIRRDDRDFTISYRPRGDTVPAWQWERIATVAEETCRAARVAAGPLPYVMAPDGNAE